MPVDKTPLFRARVKMIRTQEATRSKRAQVQNQRELQAENSLDNFEQVIHQGFKFS